MQRVVRRQGVTCLLTLLEFFGVSVFRVGAVAYTSGLPSSHHLSVIAHLLLLTAVKAWMLSEWWFQLSKTLNLS